VTTFYTIDSANARIPEVRELLLRLRDDREELVRLRDQLAALRSGGDPADGPESAGIDASIEPETPADEAAAQAEGSSPNGRDAVREGQRIALRTQGVVDQMQASVATIDGWGIALRDIQAGLIDFPALVSGRQVWLCWQLGEGHVDWWHELSEGFGGRRRLADLA